ncbi:MAG: phosphoribosylanthranilate isomerase [Candidatus Hydrothermarchaeales archaeon]
MVDIPSSPRSISIERSRGIISALPSSAKGIVVMAPKSLEEVKVAAELINPCCVQLHGGESLEFVERVKEEVSCGVIKVIHVKGKESIDEALAFSNVCDAVLLDTSTKELGGSGKTHNWDVSSQIVNQVNCHVFLAGGLNPENVKRAVEYAAPYCVDVSSGVEAVAGKKDLQKVKRFIEAAKGVP